MIIFECKIVLLVELRKVGDSENIILYYITHGLNQKKSCRFLQMI